MLNASNYPRVPIFPYAFVQVSEVARRHGLRVVTHDLLGTPGSDLRIELQRLLDKTRPRAIGLHLRRTDSLLVMDYRPLPGAAAPQPFLPVAATRAVIALLRELCDLPIVIGGHGFSSNAHGLFQKLRPDFGVVGDPDAFFARFDDVLQRRELATVENLLHWDGERAVENPRGFFGPSPNPEYTDDMVEEVRRFYGTRFMPTEAAAVEVMRGCPYHCYFCVEPAVKGRKAAIRDLDVVMDDIERVSASGIRRIWLVCSELNVFGPGLALELAERITRLREKTGRDIRWHAFSLPSRIGVDTWRTLARAGFRGGFSTWMSLDDENLRRGRVPHRASDALDEYQAIETVADELGPAGEDLRARGTMGIFLGNSFASPATVARSLEALDSRGLLETARVPVVISAMRTFEVLIDEDGKPENPKIAFDERGLADPEVASLPTFEYSQTLLDHFGDRGALDEFFAWLETTVLSKQHEQKREWALFLANHTTPAELAGWLGKPEAEVRSLFFSPLHRRKESEAQAHALLAELFAGEAGQRVCAALGIDAAAPVFALLRPLYASFDSVEQALAAVGEDRLERFLAQYLLYLRNVVLDPRYRAALFHSP